MSQSEVIPGLLIGSKPSPGRHKGIDVIVLAASEYQPPAVHFTNVEVIHAPLGDVPKRPMYESEILTATRTASWVARRVRAGRRVLVSCRMGINRSSLIAALAMLELVPGRSSVEIVRRIRAARGQWALTNPHFERLLHLVAEIRTLGHKGTCRVEVPPSTHAAASTPVAASTPASP